MIISITIGIIGSWTKTYISEGGYELVLGQVILGIANCFSVGLVTRVSVVWFKEEYRILATTVITATYLLGIALGFS